MPKYRVRVKEDVTATYDWVEIEAADEGEAADIAEEMRCQGELGKPSESVDDIDTEVHLVAPDPLPPGWREIEA